VYNLLGEKGRGFLSNTFSYWIYFTRISVDFRDVLFFIHCFEVSGTSIDRLSGGIETIFYFDDFREIFLNIENIIIFCRELYIELLKSSERTWKDSDLLMKEGINRKFAIGIGVNTL